MLRVFNSLALVASILILQPLTAQTLMAHTDNPGETSAKVYASGPFKQVDLTNLSASEASALQLNATNDLHLEDLTVLADESGKTLAVSFESPRQGNTTLVVYDAMGKKLYKERIKNHQGAFAGEIDLQNQVTGIVYLVIEQDRRSLSKKVLL